MFVRNILSGTVHLKLSNNLFERLPHRDMHRDSFGKFHFVIPKYNYVQVFMPCFQLGPVKKVFGEK